MGERIRLPVSNQIRLEQFFDRLLAMKADRVIGNLLGVQVVLGVEKVVFRLGQPLFRKITFRKSMLNGYGRNSL